MPGATPQTLTFGARAMASTRVAPSSPIFAMVYDRKSGFRLNTFWSSRLTMQPGVPSGIRAAKGFREQQRRQQVHVQMPVPLFRVEARQVVVFEQRGVVDQAGGRAQAAFAFGDEA